MLFKRRISRFFLTIFCIALLGGCALFKPRTTGIGKPITWDTIAGWEEDNHAEAWPALVNNCRVLSKKPNWSEICLKISEIQENGQPDNLDAKQFFETWFNPHPVYARRGKTEGLITGYYEPLLFGSIEKSHRYRFPVYQQPETLLTIDLSSLYPELKGKHVRGRQEGNKIVPFYSREEIESNREILTGEELLWLDDRDAVFFLHIQGSGRVQLDTGETVGVGYSNQNGHPYVAIGRVLLDRSELNRDKISLFSIRKWLQDNPEQAEELLNQNPSYVFFVLRENLEKGPVGSLNVPLIAERSLAVDPKVVKLGTPVWLSTNVPGNPEEKYQRLVIAQDTGGAIKGSVRADLFWGHGDAAEQSAGIMKERGRMFVLLPKRTEADSD